MPTCAYKVASRRRGARRHSCVRLHSWRNRSRRFLVRWERLERTYLAFVHNACALRCF
jgi:hypothetical protein